MSQNFVNLESLFDAEEYRRSGNSPWTFFAYPTFLADADNLPPLADACRFLSEIQAREIEVAIWVFGANGTTYFACKRNDVRRLHHAIKIIELTGSFGPDFFARCSEELFARLTNGT